MTKIVFAAVVLLSGSVNSLGQQKTPGSLVVPAIPGISVRVLNWTPLPDSATGALFRFADARIVIQVGKAPDLWSRYEGKTWAEGSEGPSGKTILELRLGEILAVGMGASAGSWEKSLVTTNKFRLLSAPHEQTTLSFSHALRCSARPI